MGYRVAGDCFNHEVVDLWKSRVDMLVVIHSAIRSLSYAVDEGYAAD